MKKNLFFILLICCCHLAEAQMHDNHWIFGWTSSLNSNTNGTLIHFENGYPAFTLADIRQDYSSYCIVCSDSSGNLIFHTNGRQIRNRLHALMENGDSINPGQDWVDYPNDYPSVAGGMAIPAPGKVNFYYIIHVSNGLTYDPDILCPLLYYSLVDMNQNGGLGRVVEKNQLIAEGNLPSPVLIKHGNGRDWWLIAGDYITKTYKIFIIDPNGIHSFAQQSIAPSSLSSLAFAKAAPDGKHIVVNDDSTGLWIFDFDRCSGTLSSPKVLPYIPQVFWTVSNVYSADSRFFYAGNHLVIYQLDMQTLDSSYIAFDTIGRYEYGASPAPPYYTHFFMPELASDNRIYYTTYNNSKAFHVINRPYLPLLAADFTQRGLELPKHSDLTRFNFPNYRLGRWMDAPCDTLDGLIFPDSRFVDTTWSGTGVLKSDEKIQILKLPPQFQLPTAERPSKTLENHWDLKALMIDQRKKHRQ